MRKLFLSFFYPNYRGSWKPCQCMFWGLQYFYSCNFWWCWRAAIELHVNASVYWLLFWLQKYVILWYISNTCWLQNRQPLSPTEHRDPLSDGKYTAWLDLTIFLFHLLQERTHLQWTVAPRPHPPLGNTEWRMLDIWQIAFWFRYKFLRIKKNISVEDIRHMFLPWYNVYCISGMANMSLAVFQGI